MARRFLPPFSEVLTVFLRLWGEGAFPIHLGATLLRMAAGGLVAAVMGVALGTAMGYRRVLADLFRPLAEFLRPMPPVAIIPALILLLGIGDGMKGAVIALGCVWPILLNTADGVGSVHPILIDAARNFRFSHAATLRKIVLPAALPQIAAGLRVSLAIAFILSLVSEMIGSTNGLGYFVLVSQRTFRVREMYAGIVLLAIVGCLLNAAFMAAERPAGGGAAE
jgi:ABC-type nitrate/sulfonate/bicarbonate transport system permease component